MQVGASQGSILAATLYRLHIHFLPFYFCSFASHMSADDLAIQINGELENWFSRNIWVLEYRAKKTLDLLGKFE